MKPLDDADSRRLFFKRIFLSDDPCPAELEEVSTRILKKCSGLPLAIVTFASLLANKTHNKDEWERLQDYIGTGSSLENDGNLKGLKDILLLSYWDLPHDLKTCLLYLCIYGEDYEMEREELKVKWIAEGFLDRLSGRLDQVAENCFNEVVNRNMIQAVHVGYDGSVESCRVHDMVLDLIMSLSDEENFATALNGCVCNSFPSKIRRLSVHYICKEHKVASAITENKLHVRSLSMFRQFMQMPYLVDFHALRVLDLRGCERLENKHVKNIGSSRQLRYLRIDSNEITELPEDIGKLQHLETLNLKSCFSLQRLPSTVVKLQKLVHLFVSSQTGLPAVDFGSMQALEALDVNIWYTDNPIRFAEELGHLTKLKKLDIELSFTNDERNILMTRRYQLLSEEPLKFKATRERLMGILVSSITGLGKCNLRYLRIHEGEIGERLFCKPCCTCPYLQGLTILQQVKMVPKGMASLKNLVKLSIRVEDFDKEGLHLLMGMPSLAHLELGIRRRIKENLAVGGNGFKLLKELYINIRNLFFDHSHFRAEPTDRLQLTFAAGAAPALRRLHLELKPMRVTPDCFAELGVEHLSGLAHFHVTLFCAQAAPGWVEALESSIEKAVELQPNSKLEIHVRRWDEDLMYKDDKEWEEADAKERNMWEEHREMLRKSREEESEMAE